MSDAGGLRQTQVCIGERELGIEHSRFVPVPEGKLLEELLAVREEPLRTVKEHRKHGFVIDIVEDLIGHLSLTPSSTAERHGVTYNTANDAFSKLESMGILREITGAKYGRIFVCPPVRRIVTRP